MLVLLHSLALYLTDEGEWEEEKTEKETTQADIWKEGLKSIQEGGESFVDGLNGLSGVDFDGSARSVFESFSSAVDGASDMLSKMNDTKNSMQTAYSILKNTTQA